MYHHGNTTGAVSEIACTRQTVATLVPCTRELRKLSERILTHCIRSRAWSSLQSTTGFCRLFSRTHRSRPLQGDGVSSGFPHGQTSHARSRWLWHPHCAMRTREAGVSPGEERHWTRGALLGRNESRGYKSPQWAGRQGGRDPRSREAKAPPQCRPKSGPE